jgi:hypothetical protein
MNSEGWQQAEREPQSMQGLQHPNPGWGRSPRREVRAMAVTCDFYGVEEDKITIEVDERFLREHQLFDFEGERYIILSVVWTRDGPKANVMPYWEYTSLRDKSRRATAWPAEGEKEPPLVREIDRRGRTS